MPQLQVLAPSAYQLSEKITVSLCLRLRRISRLRLKKRRPLLRKKLPKSCIRVYLSFYIKSTCVQSLFIKTSLSKIPVVKISSAKEPLKQTLRQTVQSATKKEIFKTAKETKPVEKIASAPKVIKDKTVCYNSSV